MAKPVIFPIKVLSIILSLISISYAQGSTIFLEPPEQIIYEVGEIATIHVVVKGVTDLFGFQFDLRFDPSVVECIEILEGTLLKAAGNTFWKPPEINNRIGLLSKATDVLTEDSGGSTGDGILATITFRVLELRESMVELQNVVLFDRDANIMKADVVNGKIMPGLRGKWQLQQSGISVNLRDVCFVDAHRGWVVGDSGAILRTDDGGLSWKKQTSGTQKSLLGVHFADAKHGIVVGEEDTLLYANEGVVTWVFTSPGEEYIWRGVHLTAPSGGLIVGNSPWTSIRVGGSVVDRFSISGPASRTAMNEHTDTITRGEYSFFDVFFAGVNQGWVVGTGGDIYHTDDGGITFTPQIRSTYEDLFAVHFANAQEGWAVGDKGTILHTVDGGAIWRPQSSSALNALRGVYFVSPNEGWAVGDNGTILYTGDSGATWEVESVDTKQNLNSVYFANPNEGWAVGDNGSVLKFTDTDIQHTVYEKEIVLKVGEERTLHASLACGLSPDLYNASIDSSLPSFIIFALQDVNLSPGGSIDVSYTLQISDDAPLGRYDEKITLAFPTDKEISCSAEVALRIVIMGGFVDVAGEAKVADRGSGHTAAFMDYNNDGRLDIYLVNMGQSNMLYRNNGDGTFSDLAAIAGVQEPDYASCITVGDYDNDGYIDIYLTSADGDILYHNDGDGTFTDVTAIAGIRGVGQAAAFSDFDNDGHLDLYVVCVERANVLYRNNGDGTFSDVTTQAGVGDTGIGYAMAVGDYDNDGDADIYVTNINQQFNLLYRNNGDSSFTDVAFNAGVWNPPGSDFSAAFADYDNDGFLDLYVASDQIDVIYRNNGNGTFSNFAFDAGVAEAENGRYMAFGDYDNDGYIDVYVVNFCVSSVDNQDQGNVLFLNRGDGTFWNIGYDVNAADEGNGWAVTTCDYDNDGDLDLYVVKDDQPNLLYRNRFSNGNWLIVELIGTESNRSGIGARITATSGELSQMREINSSAQNGLQAHFGLGEYTRVDKLQIHWPSGTIQSFFNIAANQMLEIEEKDTDSPSIITDLSTSKITTNSVMLTWVAPGDDDDIGTATRYDMRYYTKKIYEGNWDDAERVGLPAPKPSGTVEQYLLENLRAATTYYAAIRALDEVGNRSPMSEVIQFTTYEDTTVPSIVATSPRENAVDVPVNLLRVAVRLSELMDADTLNERTVSLIDESGEVVSGKLLYQPSLDLVSYFLKETLSPDMSYTMNLSKDVRDSVGTGLSRDYKFQFTTGKAKDTEPPSILSALPYSNSMDVPINLHSIGIMISEDLDIGTISGNVLVVESSRGDDVPGDIQYSAKTSFIGFHPEDLLAPFETYTVKLTAEVTDLSGNSLPPFNWQFRTGGQMDLSPPMVAATYPERGAKDVVLVDRRISAKFDEPIAPDSLSNGSFQLLDSLGQVVSGYVEYEASQSVLRFTPEMMLAANTTYTPIVKAGLADLSGNTIESDLAWSFSTIETTGKLLFSVLSYPNPFDPSQNAATLQYGLRRPAEVTIEVYSITGDLVKLIVRDIPKPPGLHQTEQWDGKDENEDEAIHGMYIYRISAREAQEKAGTVTGIMVVK